MTAAGVPNRASISEADAIQQAAAGVLPGEGPVLAIDTSREAMAGDGINVAEAEAAAAGLPAPGEVGSGNGSSGGGGGGGGGGRVGGRRTLGGVGGRRAGPANVDEQRGPIASNTVVTVKKLE